MLKVEQNIKVVEFYFLKQLSFILHAISSDEKKECGLPIPGNSDTESCCQKRVIELCTVLHTVGFSN